MLERDLDEILADLRPCFQCGTCSGGCPIFMVDPQRNPRVTVEKLLLGDTGVLEDSDNIFYCTTCGTCYSRCPQKIDLSHLLIELKNWVIVNKNKLPDHLKAEMDMLLKTGNTQEITGMVAKRRKKLGLPELATGNMLEEVQKIMEASGFKHLKNKYDESKGENKHEESME
ncbi:MAG: 4Fe-4S dicluster domain-containing protein [Candidatus Odinarchaeota archaeon]